MTPKYSNNVCDVVDVAVKRSLQEGRMQQGERKEAEMDDKCSLIDKELPVTTVYTDTSESTRSMPHERPVSCRARISLALLVLINFINYMDRLTIAGKKNIFFCPKYSVKSRIT